MNTIFELYQETQSIWLYWGQTTSCFLFKWIMNQSHPFALVTSGTSHGKRSRSVLFEVDVCRWEALPVIKWHGRRKVDYKVGLKISHLVTLVTSFPLAGECEDWRGNHKPNVILPRIMRKAAVTIEAIAEPIWFIHVVASSLPRHSNESIVSPTTSTAPIAMVARETSHRNISSGDCSTEVTLLYTHALSFLWRARIENRDTAQ